MLAVLIGGVSIASIASGEGRRLSPAKPLRVLTAPQGDFTIAVPPGWSFMAGMSENPIKVAPLGQTEPQIYIIAPPLLNIDRLASHADEGYQQCLRMAAAGYNITSCVLAVLNATSQAELRKWTAYEAGQIIASALTRQGLSNHVAFTAISPSKAVAKGRIARGRLSVDEFVRINLLYVPDPSELTFLARPGWVAYAFLFGCEARSGELNPEYLSACEAVLASFRPGPHWLVGQILQQAREYRQMANTIVSGAQRDLAIEQRTTQTIAETGRAVSEMQFNRFMENFSGSLDLTEREMRALNGTVDLTNPQTGQVFYQVDNNFRNDHYFCQTAQGLLASDVPGDIKGNPLCQAPLTRLR